MADFDRAELLKEAVRRGLISKEDLRAEAERRGLVAPASPPETPEQAEARVPEGMVFDHERQVYVDTRAEAERRYREDPAYRLAAYGTKVMQGVPFAGEWVDEGVGALGGDLAKGRWRAAGDELEKNAPASAILGEIGGGLLGTAAAIRAIGPSLGVVSPQSFTGRTIAGTVAGGVGGAVEGGVAGAGANEQDRAAGAKTGAMVGGGIGAALGAVGPVVGDAIGEGVDALRTRAARRSARGVGGSPEAVEMVGEMLVNDGRGAAVRRIRQGGPSAMIADAGPTTRALLDSAVQQPGPAARIATNAIERRVGAESSALTRAMDRALGKPQGVKSLADDIAGTTRPARKAAYDAAYNSPIDYASPQGRKVEEVLGRVPPGLMQAAVREANEEMVSRGLKNQQILAQVADDGSIVLREMPNVRQLDELKQALDRLVETDEFGRVTKAGLRPQRLAREMRDALSEAVPKYRTALKVGGDKIAQDNALRFGRSAMTRSVTREDVALQMRGATAQERAALRKGVRAELDERLANVRRTITDDNQEAREGMQALREFSSRASQEKMRLILGKEEAAKLQQQIDRTARAFETRSRMAQNSATFVRRKMDEALAAKAEPGALAKLVTLQPGKAAQELAGRLTRMGPEEQARWVQQIAGEMATMMTGPQGRDAAKKAAEVIRHLERYPTTKPIGDAVSRTISGSTMAVGYQAAGQQTSP